MGRAGRPPALLSRHAGRVGSRALRAFLSALFAVLASAAFAAANSDYDTAPEGAAGEIRNAMICYKRGEYVVGFEGRTGSWIDRIAIICAPLLPSGAMGKPYTISGAGGGGGGPAGPVKCANGLLTDLAWHTMNGNGVVRNVNGLCKDPVSGANLGPPQVVFGPVGGVAYDADYSRKCPKGMALTGIRVNWGQYVNAIGIVCAKLKPPKPPVASTPSDKVKPLGMIFCQGGGMTVGFGPLNLSIGMNFRAAPQSARAAIPARGECAWSDRPIGPNEPKTMFVPIKPETKPVVEAAQKGGIFLVTVGIAGNGFWVTKVESVNVGFVPGKGPGASGQGGGGGAGFVANAPPEAGGGKPAGVPAGGGIPSAGCPAGAATVSTPEGLDFLNVRDGPSSAATIVAQVPNGSEVSVSGSCLKPAAGFAIQKPAAGGNWCRITAPDQGCVAAQFLVFGGGGGGGLKPAAGFAREKPKGKGGAGFTGRWKAVADGVSYSMSLTQTPKGAVTGQFSGSDGSAGNINGSVSGNTLRFRWVQSSDSQRGAGKFVLASDGRSFTGSYSFSDNPDAVEGSWNGTRQ
jgi:hypothetical protein